MPGTATCGCGKTISANKLTCGACAANPLPDHSGCLEILNVQGGDVKITFDKNNVAETIRAKRIVSDMLRRGYALVVEVKRKGKTAYERIKAFDEARAEYIIADLDSEVAAEADKQVDSNIVTPPKRGRPPKTSRLPMQSTRATAIGRSAGG